MSRIWQITADSKRRWSLATLAFLVLAGIPVAAVPLWPVGPVLVEPGEAEAGGAVVNHNRPAALKPAAAVQQSVSRKLPMSRVAPVAPVDGPEKTRSVPATPEEVISRAPDSTQSRDVGGEADAAARTATFEWLPVSGGGTIVGNTIFLPPGPNQVTFHAMLSGWDTGGAGTPRVQGYQFEVDATSYTSGLAGSLSPLTFPDASAGCFIDAAEPGFIFSGLGHIKGTNTVSTTCVGGANDGASCTVNADCPGGSCELNYDWFALTNSAGDAVVDTGARKYLGTLILDVPPDAQGSFTISFTASPSTNILLDQSALDIPFVTQPGFIEVDAPLIGACCISDGNACLEQVTQQDCENDGGVWGGPATDCGGRALCDCCVEGDGAGCVVEDGCDDPPGVPVFQCLGDGNGDGLDDACPAALPTDTCPAGALGTLASGGGTIPYPDTTGLANDYGDSGITDGDACDPNTWNRPVDGSGPDAIGAFQVDASGTWNFTTCGENADTSLMVLEDLGGGCPGDVVIGCNGDDAEGCPGSPDPLGQFASDLSVTLCAGSDYYILLDGWSAGSFYYNPAPVVSYSRTAGGCLDNADCDDGLFCNGFETCDGCQCQPGTPPTCNPPTAHCDEDTDACISCTSKSDPAAACGDDDVPCNGLETCNPTTGGCEVLAPCDSGEYCFDGFCSGSGESCYAGRVTNPDLDCPSGETCVASNTSLQCIGDSCAVYWTSRSAFFGPKQGFAPAIVGDDVTLLPGGGRNLISYEFNDVCRDGVQGATVTGPYDLTTELWTADPTTGAPLAPIPGTQCSFLGLPCGNGIDGDPNRTARNQIVCEPNGGAPTNVMLPEGNPSGTDFYITYTATSDSQGFAIAGSPPESQGIIVGSSQDLVARSPDNGVNWTTSFFTGPPLDANFGDAKVCASCFEDAEYTGADECVNTSVVPVSVGSAGEPIVTTIAGNNSDATGPDCSELGSAAIHWEAFTISQCANVRLDFCCTVPDIGPSFTHLRTDCPLGGSCGPFVGANSAARGGPYCNENNLWQEYFGLSAGTYYYPMISGYTCSTDADTACNPFNRTCVGGSNDGAACTTNAECPGGTCELTSDCPNDGVCLDRTRTYQIHITADEGSGACCDPASESCVDNVLESDCNLQGGVFSCGQRCCEVECRETPPEYDSDGVFLLSHLDFGQFNVPPPDFVNTGNEMWGYVSPSGREYAVMQFRTGTSFVDVSDPIFPEVVGWVSGEGIDQPWRDAAVHQFSDGRAYAYIVHDVFQGEGPGIGLQVVDLTDIDDGVVSHVNTTDLGVMFEDAHNVAVNPDSGYLYLCIPGFDGPDVGLLVANLNANAVSPPIVGQWDDFPPGSNVRCHDVQVVSYDSGPWAGREIAFCPAESDGFYIGDVTDKNNMFTLGSLAYPNVVYAHQGWLTEDRRYFIMGDELDERDDPDVDFTRTLVIDVSDLTNPMLHSEIFGTTCAIEHNMMIRGSRLYEAGYTAGLRVYDISYLYGAAPGGGFETAFFDTHPEDNVTLTRGMWGVYTDYPSGIIATSTIDRAMFLFCDETTGPVASFMQAFPPPGNPVACGEVVMFDGQLSPSCDPASQINRWEWDFDHDGETFDVEAIDPNVMHAYSTPGEHTVALRVIGDELSSACMGPLPGACSIPTLVPLNPPILDDRAGTSVAVDGRLAVVGIPGKDTPLGTGEVVVYRENTSVWSPDGGLLGPAPSATEQFFGQAVDVSGDVIAVGAPGEEGVPGVASGVAYAFRNIAGTWLEQARLVPSDPEAGASFGESVTVDGNRLIVGAPGDDCFFGPDCGAVYVFRYNGSSWVQTQKLTAPAPAGGELFGTAVALDGTALVVGAPGPVPGNSGGAGYVFFDASSIFPTAGFLSQQQLLPSDPPGGDDYRFGEAVAVENRLIVVGAWGRDCPGVVNCGTAYVFRQVGGVWTEEQMLTDPAPAVNDLYADSVAISDGAILVGSPFDACEGGGAQCGAAYLYRHDGSTWNEEQRIEPDQREPLDWFGTAVALSDENAIVGAPAKDCGVCVGGDNAGMPCAGDPECAAGVCVVQSDCGAAYVFSTGRTDLVTHKVTVVGPCPCIDESDCTDDNVCNGIETCADGECLPGTPPNCDDLNACTTDSCSPSLGCQNVAVADGTPCEAGGECVGGFCTVPSPESEDDSDESSSIGIAAIGDLGGTPIGGGANRSAAAAIYETTSGRTSTYQDLIYSEVSKVDTALAISDLRVLDEPLVAGSSDVISIHPALLQEILTGEGVAKVSALAYAGTDLIQKQVRAHFAGAAARAVDDSTLFEFFNDSLDAGLAFSESLRKAVTLAECDGGSLDGEPCASNVDCPGGVCGVPCSDLSCVSVTRLRNALQEAGVSASADLAAYAKNVQELTFSIEDQREYLTQFASEPETAKKWYYYGGKWTGSLLKKRAFIGLDAARSAPRDAIVIRGNDTAGFAEQQVSVTGAAVQAAVYQSAEKKWVLAAVVARAIPSSRAAADELALVFWKDTDADGLVEEPAFSEVTLDTVALEPGFSGAAMYQTADDEMLVHNVKDGKLWKVALSLEGVATGAAARSVLLSPLMERPEISETGGFSWFFTKFKKSISLSAQNRDAAEAFAEATRYIFTSEPDPSYGTSAFAVDVVGETVVGTELGTLAQVRAPNNPVLVKLPSVLPEVPMSSVEMFGNPAEVLSVSSIGRGSQQVLASAATDSAGTTGTLATVSDINRRDLLLVEVFGAARASVSKLVQFIPELGEPLDSIDVDTDIDGLVDRVQLSVNPHRVHLMKAVSAGSSRAAESIYSYQYDQVLLRVPLGTDPETSEAIAFREVAETGEITVIGTTVDFTLKPLPSADPLAYWQPPAVDLDDDGTPAETVRVFRALASGMWRFEVYTGLSASRSAPRSRGGVILPPTLTPKQVNVLDLDGDGDLDAQVDDFDVLVARAAGGPVCLFNLVKESGTLAFEERACPSPLSPPAPAGAPHDVRKNRFISVDPTTSGTVPIVLRVELLDLACSTTGKHCTFDADCKACVSGGNNGLGCEVNSDCSPGSCAVSGETCVEQSPPVVLGWVSDPVVSPGGSPPGTVTATVQNSMPAPRIWAENPVHVGDCEIAPVTSYAIRSSQDGVSFSEPLYVGTIGKPQSKFWGDTVGNFNGVDWTAPNFLVNVDDVVAWVKYVTLKPAPHITVVDLDGEAPNFVINATDLQFVLQGFGGKPYPPSAFPTQGGPQSCP